MANLKQIEKYLKKAQLPYKVVDLNEEAYTVDDVVKSGINPDEVVKTLIIRTPSNLTSRLQVLSEHGSKSDLMGQANDGFVALALRGIDRVDFKKVRAKFGGKSELAKPEEVSKAVGVPIGAVCPVLVGIPLYVDHKVMDLDNVHMGSGDLMHGLEMKLDDLFKALGKYQLEDFSVSV